MGKIAGVVISMNEAKRIAACLDSLAFCDEIVVVDSGSTDGTIEILRRSGSRWVVRPFTSWNAQKEYARGLVTSRWVLNIDADEVVSSALRDEILAVVSREEHAAYRVPFRNHLHGEWIRTSGFYPDYHVRLFRTDRAHWDVSSVHDRVVVSGSIGTLDGHIEHHSFESIADYVEKSLVYADAFARDAFEKGRTCGLGAIALHTASRFVRAFFLERGIFGGALGWTMSGLRTLDAFLKYVRLWELGRLSNGGETKAIAPDVRGSVPR